MASEALDSATAYGCLAFDVFLMLEAAYSALAEPYVNHPGLDGMVDEASPLDDPGLYGSCEGDWKRLLLRVPELCDTVRFSIEEEYENNERWMEEAEDELDRFSRMAAATVFEVDAEALEDGWLKLLRLDYHGESLWHNRVRSGDILEFTGAREALV
ncbi:predicted protein [Chaetomium globosum CBS 148.51]|uniref:Uncharacterized protein n=1 Tax=Chaetomium globosum (strain ATCC 6205 / CBS 148.51 / DSM 1962 / NBRC 6347 / NRRL 1970) TaxID=306901 RepID=Q2HHK7_CHAGB|nr:uncharacterized protein CHGG_00297 [Chaetomium globosum CBS 148.51]EAQ92062.1 predicted protein [Chaetomium globosum CBS 148.51]